MRSRANDYGFGFCTEKRPDGALVVYTDVPRVREKRVIVPFEHLDVVQVPKGTRVWLKGDPYGWHAAEITAPAGFNAYHVRVPGIPHDVKLTGDRFVVRWNRPLADPVEALANGFCDSPEYYEARRDFRDELLRQRQTSRGFTAVLSAPVEFYPHQLDTVARVLSDPVLRYLLADEVGLGKTVEAGLILRQLLLDDARATSLVAVPTSLLQQWRGELRDRFLLGTALSRGRIRLIAHEQLCAEGDLRAHAVVVVDEAHRLIPHLDRTPMLRTALLATRGLLLLSATPMRGDPRILLELLHLIDSTAFPRDAVDAFRERMRAREREATSLEVLTSSRAGLLLRSGVLDELSTAHGNDPVLVHLVDSCRVAAEPDDPAWSKLVNYVRETYRISRRIIRHRRNTDATVEYPVTGRETTFIPLDDPARDVVDEFLDQYRDLLDQGSDPTVFGRAVVSGLGGPRALLRYLDRRLSAPESSDLFVPEHHRALFRTTTAELELIGTGARTALALDLVENALRDGLKVVVVVTSTDIAQEFIQAARSRWPKQVGGHLGSMSPADREQDVEHFLASHGGRVLVGDHTVEEGRNLQDAHVLLNLDLPLDPNRLEQRIGRLDRFASRSGERANVLVVTEPNSEWLTSHLRLLRDGIGIFSTSVATLQQKLSEILGELARDLPSKGSLAFEMDLMALRESLKDEETDVDLLEELESVTVASDFDPAGVAELREEEEDSRSLKEAFTRLTSMRGGLDLRPVEHPATGVVEFDGSAGRSIFGVSQDVAIQVLPLLKRRRAYARAVATSHSGIAPLRLGDPLIDWLEEYLRIDERGRARAVVRPYREVKVPTLWLSCDFLVEFDASRLQAESEAVRRRLRRRGDALLPPVIERTWTDSAGPADHTLLEVLEKPYEGGSDRLLKGREWTQVLAELPDWRVLCEASAEAAWDSLRATPALTTAPVAAVERAHEETERRRAVLTTRSQRLPFATERQGALQELRREEELGAALLGGVREPAVSIVACGAVVLWPAL
ncbi:protein DpdE [Saccharothrix sp. ALI-22-I]|uniref:protein DpdE n=1 Tax=Saccharothrix sp. ALI-22-I TaxID=1933778 RepID=UPI002378E0CA|nr:protein DpdE [Saccharothrix sp. ALI-22-I]